jgi:hypothetical protein
MDVFWVVVVILLLVAAFGYVAYLYMKEAGPESAKLWLTSSRLMRTSGGVRSAPSGSLDSQSQVTTALADDTADVTAPAAAQLASQDRRLAFDSDAIRQMKEEFQRELREAVGRSREFDARLTRVETTTVEAPRIPEVIDGLRQEQRGEIEQLRVSMDTLRQRAGAYGERRGQALSELYGSLARVESALAAVVNPMLLPGESLSLLPEFPPEAMQWANWGDVGERAYAFGNVFNEHRLVLDKATAEEIATFIGTLRAGLTGSVYPAVRSGKPTADQIAQMRLGLTAIVAALPLVRSQIEDAYREDR